MPIGQAEVRAVFGAGSGRVAGCMVTEGKLVKGAGVRVTRGGVDVHVGLIDSLRRVKELAKEVRTGSKPVVAAFVECLCVCVMFHKMLGDLKYTRKMCADVNGSKVCGPYVVTLLNRTPLCERYMGRLVGKIGC